MPARTMAFLLTLLASIAVAASQPVAKVQLPCESHDQTLSPTGSQLLVACTDHSLQLVAVSDGKLRELLPATRRASEYVFSADGRWIALGFADGTVEVVSSEDAASRKQWKAADRRIDLLYFLPDATTLVVAPTDSPGQVWKLSQTPAIGSTLPLDFGGISAMAASPDGKVLITAAGDTVLRWYDTATWRKTREYRDFLLDTFSLKFTPDGKQVVAGGADGRITTLDAGTAKLVRQTSAQEGWFIIELDLLDQGRIAIALYADDTGENPPVGLIWDLAAGESTALPWSSLPTCGGVVNDKFRVCTTQGKTLTITQLE